MNAATIDLAIALATTLVVTLAMAWLNLHAPNRLSVLKVLTYVLVVLGCLASAALAIIIVLGLVRP